MQELAFSILPIRLTSFKKIHNAAEGVRFDYFSKLEALVEPLWDFNGAELGLKTQLSRA